MTFRTRFIALAVFNCFVVVAFLWLVTHFKLELSQRLIDLNLDTTRGLYTFLAFIAGIAVNFLVNFLLLSSRKSEFTYEQVAGILQHAKHSA
jgi:putative flippase GtrA